MARMRPHFASADVTERQNGGGTRPGPGRRAVGKDHLCRAAGDADRPKAGSISRPPRRSTARCASGSRPTAGPAPGRFATIEEPINLTDALIESSKEFDVVLVDCLTLWITNLLGARRRRRRRRSRSWWSRCSRSRRARVILVSNEVGLGIVPDNALARTLPRSRRRRAPAARRNLRRRLFRRGRAADDAQGLAAAGAERDDRSGVHQA